MVDWQRQLGEERQQLDLEVEENQSERNQKYRELRKREETMDTFLGSYAATREEELHQDVNQRECRGRSAARCPRGAATSAVGRSAAWSPRRSTATSTSTSTAGGVP